MSESVGKLMEEYEALGAEIGNLYVDRNDVATQIAQLTCPYQKGDKVTTNRPLGKNGLTIAAVIAPTETTETNRWQLQCYALSKAGEITARMVGVTEEQAAECELKKGS